MIYLTEEQLLIIKKEVKDNFYYYIKHYQSDKYPEDVYIQSKVKFKNPQSVTASDITKALEWKYGHLNKNNYPAAHKSIINTIILHWSDFCRVKCLSTDNIYNFWKEKLKVHQNFITIAYIIHLIKSDEIQIIDQHNFRAFNYLVSLVKAGHSYSKKPSSLLNLKNYNHFFNQLLSIIDIKENKKRNLDKFLMMYGKYFVKERS